MYSRRGWQTGLVADSAHLDRLYRGFQPFEDWVGSSIDLSLWDDARVALAEAREAADPETFDALLQEVLRQAAIDTGAIEQLYSTERGFTITVAGMATAWEAEIAAQKGEDVARMVVGHKQGYDLALDVATHTAPMTETLVRQLHEAVCAGQDTYDVRTPAGPQRHPLPKGEYKRHANHVETADGTMHAYAPVDDVPEEMHRLVSVLQSDRFEQAHPVVQAAWAHHTLVVVHPFADGNGRTARVLSSVYLLRATSVPLVIFADQRPDYLVALADADDGRADRFVTFVRDRSVDSLLYLTERLRGSQQGDEALHRLRATFERSDETNTAGVRLYESLVSELRRRTYELQGDRAFTIFDEEGGNARDPIPGTRYIVRPKGPAYRVIASAGGVHESEILGVFVTDDPEDPFRLGVNTRSDHEPFRARLSDVVPQATSAMTLRLRAWVDRIIDDLLARLADKLDAT